MEDEKTITLTREQFDILLLMAGYASGAAMQAKDARMAWSFVHLTNVLNKDNPDFTPYEIPPEFRG